MLRWVQAGCNGWVLFENNCYLKAQTALVAKAGCTAGIKCTGQAAGCTGKCQGNYPHGCNDSFNLGYCNSSGGCSYSQQTDTNIWCCFKGC